MGSHVYVVAALSCPEIDVLDSKGLLEAKEDVNVLALPFLALKA